MSTLNPSKLIALGVLAIAACASGAVEAKECQWFGTAPLCDGSCPAGWDLVDNSGDGCIGTWGISGTKAYCCKHEAHCTTYGTPDCPYPPFGSSSSNTQESQPSGPQPSPDVIMNRKHESEPQGGQDSSGVLVPEPSKGPSPFGSSSADSMVMKKGVIDSNMVTPETKGVIDPMVTPGTKASENPCGAGMTLGKDGQCYPILH